VKIVRGLDDGSMVEIVSGDLKPGDQVVIDQNNPDGTGRRPGGPMGRPMGMPHHF
jgi:hypothetical protein